jgi:hypothetical protein
MKKKNEKTQEEIINIKIKNTELLKKIEEKDIKIESIKKENELTINNLNEKIKK